MDKIPNNLMDSINSKQPNSSAKFFEKNNLLYYQSNNDTNNTDINNTTNTKIESENSRVNHLNNSTSINSPYSVDQSQQINHVYNQQYYQISNGTRPILNSASTYPPSTVSNTSTLINQDHGFPQSFPTSLRSPNLSKRCNYKFILHTFENNTSNVDNKIANDTDHNSKQTSFKSDATDLNQKSNNINYNHQYLSPFNLLSQNTQGAFQQQQFLLQQQQCQPLRQFETQQLPQLQSHQLCQMQSPQTTQLQSYQHQQLNLQQKQQQLMQQQQLQQQQQYYYNNNITSDINSDSNDNLKNRTILANDFGSVIPIPGCMAYHHPLIPIIPSVLGNTKKHIEERDTQTNNQINNINVINNSKYTVFGSPIWNEKDDKLLRDLKENQHLGWRDISMYFPGRTISACQFRWRRIITKEANRKKRELKKLSIETKLNKSNNAANETNSSDCGTIDLNHNDKESIHEDSNDGSSKHVYEHSSEDKTRTKGFGSNDNNVDSAE